MNRAVHYPAIGITFPGVRDAARAWGVPEHVIRGHLKDSGKQAVGHYDAVYVPIHFVIEGRPA